MKEGTVADWKVQEVEGLTQLMKEFPVVGILNMEGMPSRQLLDMKKKLGEDAKIRMSRKRLMVRALENAKITALTEHIAGQPAFLFSKTNPFKLSKILSESKANAPAKEGAIMPKDILVPAGETGFAPGPIVGELQSMKVKAAIEGGKVVIKEDSVLAEEGEKIDKKKADVMSKLGIEPMEIGLQLLAAYENGLVFGKDVLSISTEQTLEQVRTASNNVFSLTYFLKYPTSQNIKMFVQEAFRNTKSVAMEAGYTCSATVKELLAKASAQAGALKGKVPEAPVEEKAEEAAPAEEKKEGTETATEKPKAEEAPTEEPVTEEKPAEEEKAAEPVPEEVPAEAPKEETPAEEAKPEEAPAEESKAEEKPAEEQAKKEEKPTAEE